VLPLSLVPVRHLGSLLLGNLLLVECLVVKVGSQGHLLVYLLESLESLQLEKWKIV
jgi:hypothetical protein